MNLRIGGDIELSTDILTKEALFKFDEFPIDSLHYIWTDTGRSAILLALESIAKKTTKKIVHLPTFVCDAVKQPFIQFDYQINYYSLGETLSNVDNLPIVKEDEVFFFVHYFGHQNSAVLNWLKKQKRNFFVIEDYVQASLSEFNHNSSDFQIYSFRKFTPQMDGALLRSSHPINVKLDTPNQDFLKQQLTGKLIRDWTDESKYFIELLKGSEQSLNNYIVPKSISSISKFIMERLDFNYIKTQRRANWAYFNKLLIEEPLLKENLMPLYDKVFEKEVPLGYALRVNGSRDELRGFLIEQNIFCPVHWPISYILTEGDKLLSEQIITIPLDQRIGKKEINYIIACLKTYYGG